MHVSLVGLGDGVREPSHVARDLSVSLPESSVGLRDSFETDSVLGYRVRNGLGVDEVSVGVEVVDVVAWGMVVCV